MLRDLLRDSMMSWSLGSGIRLCWFRSFQLLTGCVTFCPGKGHIFETENWVYWSWTVDTHTFKTQPFWVKQTAVIIQGFRGCVGRGLVYLLKQECVRISGPLDTTGESLSETVTNWLAFTNVVMELICHQRVGMSLKLFMSLTYLTVTKLPSSQDISGH